jgi:hypothetical protein
MEVVLTYYAIFAISTAITLLIRYYIPILNTVQCQGIKNSITTNPILGMFIFVLISICFAPIVVGALLSSKQSYEFKKGLRKSMSYSDD